MGMHWTLTSLGHDLVSLALEPKCWHGVWCPVSPGRLPWSVLIPPVV